MMDGGVDEWSSPKSKKALEIIRDMVEKGYFGTTYDSVKHTDGAAPALLEQGKAGFELMGSFGYSGHKAAALNSPMMISAIWSSRPSMGEGRRQGSRRQPVQLLQHEQVHQAS